MLKTTCTVEQYMAAVRDTDPVYYERYMTDYKNRPVDVQKAPATGSLVLLAGLRGSPSSMRRNRDEHHYEQMAPLGQPGQAVLQQQGRRRARHRRVRQLSAGRPSVWNW